ncbi:MAG: phosphate transport system protein [Rhodospirillaceae bacterium]|nr:MAG: phosphate transport system protein [Rhodospirillaceae bacterium]
MLSSHHIVKSYDDELTQLRAIIVAMGHMAAGEVASAIQSLTEQDTDLASQVIAGDHAVDDAEHQVNELTVRLLALRSPVADDLRTVVASLKMASELERVADLAVNIAKRVIVLSQFPPLPSVHGIARMGEAVVALVEAVVSAFAASDVTEALAVWERDMDVDDQCSALFRELLTYMMENPRNITACSHLMFVAKNIERVGDHATNIAEIIHYRVVGEPLRTPRPKGDTSSFRLE